MVNPRSRITVLVILLIFTSFVLSMQIVQQSNCTRCGIGDLESGEHLVESMNANNGQKMYGNFYADGAPLVLAILHEENYSEGETANCSKCVFYVFDVEEVFEIIVPKDGFWYLILSNPGRPKSSYEYTWAVSYTADIIINSICWIFIPSLLVLIIVQIILIKKGKS